MARLPRSIERPRPTVAMILRRLREYGVRRSFSYGRHWLSEQFHERRLGIETEARVELTALGFADHRLLSYSPIAYRAFWAVMREVEIDPERDVFADLGAGKGRALVLGSLLPFRRVIGVEIAPELAAIARENLDKTASRRRCREAEVVVADLSRWKIPNDLTILHLFNPIASELVDQLMKQVRKSLEEAPRTLTILYANPHRFEPYAASCGWLVRQKDVPYPFAEREDPDRFRYRIYRSKPEYSAR